MPDEEMNEYEQAFPIMMNRWLNGEIDDEEIHEFLDEFMSAPGPKRMIFE